MDTGNARAGAQIVYFSHGGGNSAAHPGDSQRSRSGSAAAGGCASPTLSWSSARTGRKRAILGLRTHPCFTDKPGFRRDATTLNHPPGNRKPPNGFLSCC